MITIELLYFPYPCNIRVRVWSTANGLRGNNFAPPRISACIHAWITKKPENVPYVIFSTPCSVSFVSHLLEKSSTISFDFLRWTHLCVGVKGRECNNVITEEETAKWRWRWRWSQGRESETESPSIRSHDPRRAIVSGTEDNLWFRCITACWIRVFNLLVNQHGYTPFPFLLILFDKGVGERPLVTLLIINVLIKRKGGGSENMEKRYSAH